VTYTCHIQKHDLIIFLPAAGFGAIIT
jgi:hypothetical protein